MPAKSLHELFIEELKDTYDAEKRLTRALPKMAKAATATDLQAAFTSHLKETEGQVRRLEKVFRAIGEKPKGKACHGIMGIIEEGSKAIEELDKGPVLDAALIAGAQKAEHYEIATYGTLAYFADMMDHQEVKNLLGETLTEEKAADAKLNTIAKSKVNQQALCSAGQDDDEEEIRIPASIRRSAVFGSLANDWSGGTARSSSRKTSGRSTARRATKRAGKKR